MSEALSSRSEKSVMKATDSSSRKGRIRTRGGPDNASCKFKGVRQRTWGKWVSEIRELNSGKRTWIGSFETAEAAAVAYDEAAIKLFGAKAKLNFPERLLQVSCPDHSAAPTSKDTLIDWKGIEIPEEGIIELQQGENPPALVYDKAAGRLAGAPENLPQVSCPVHSTAPTSKDALVDWKGIEIPEEIIELQQGENPPALAYDKAAGRLAGAPENLPQVSCPVHATAATSKDTLINSRGIRTPEQVECPPGPEFSLTTNPLDCLINDQLINNYDNYIMNEEQYDVAWIVNHDEFQGDNVGNDEGNLEEGRDNINEKLIVELPEFDDSSLWDEIMATTDLEKIENPEDSSAGNFDDFFKDISGF